MKNKICGVKCKTVEKPLFKINVLDIERNLKNFRKSTGLDKKETIILFYKNDYVIQKYVNNRKE